jgi:CBS-domain-containing membrane protein
VFVAFIGVFITLFLLFSLTTYTSTDWLIAPFEASCLLAFGVWNSPFSQPRNIIVGHVISSLVGLIIYHLFGNKPWTIALAVGLVIVLMMVTKTTHPPAARNPIIVILEAHSWSFLFMPILLGTVVIVIMALIVNNLQSGRVYPIFWR